MSVAASWEAASDQFPVEIATALEGAEDPDLKDVELLLAIPEWEVRGTARAAWEWNRSMNLEDIEIAALKLDAKGRARLAERLLESLEDLSPEENARIWAEEAQRRNAALESGTLRSRPADEVFREARRRV